MTARFDEVGDGMYVLRYPVFDVNVTLVVGDGAALLVDTLSTGDQAGELAVAARAVTPHPWTIVNTHHHFDHCFGNAALAGDPPRPIWAQEEAATLLREEPDAVRREAYDWALAAKPGLAAELAGVPILAPTRTVHREADLDIGGRRVLLRHLGRGHTAGDLVVHVPDADVLIAGDLVEEGGPPSFDDAYPLEWPETMVALLRLTTPATAVVPGHGAVVGPNFVHGQHDELTALAWLIREGHSNGSPAEAVASRAPFGVAASLPAVRRGYAELANRT